MKFTCKLSGRLLEQSFTAVVKQKSLLCFRQWLSFNPGVFSGVVCDDNDCKRLERKGKLSLLAQSRHGGIISKDVVSTAGSENHWKTCGLRHVFVSSMVGRLVAIYGLRIYTHTYIQWRRWDYCYLVRALSLLSISGRTLKKNVAHHKVEKRRVVRSGPSPPPPSRYATACAYR